MWALWFEDLGGSECGCPGSEGPADCIRVVSKRWEYTELAELQASDGVKLYVERFDPEAGAIGCSHYFFVRVLHDACSLAFAG